MTQTIEQLTAKVAELESENAKLHEQVDLQVPKMAFTQLTEQLAIAEAQNARLQRSLKASDDLLRSLPASGGFYGLAIMEDNTEALSLPASRETLDSYVAEKVNESHKVIPREGLVPHAYQLEATHNNAEYWYKLGHSEEMAAKGESVICMAQAVFAWRNAAYAKAEEVTTLTRQRDLAVEWLERCAAHVRPSATIFYEEIVEAINSIKESKAKP